MPRKPAPGLTLEQELAKMVRNAPQPQPRTMNMFMPVKAPEVKQVNGIRLSRNLIVVHGKTYNREDFRAELQRIIAEQRSDAKSAFNNTRDPNHQKTVDDFALAHAWLAGEIDEAGERAIVDEWHESTQENEMQMTVEQQLAQLMGQPGTQTALQKARTDSRSLTPAEKATVAEHNRLEAAMSAQAHKERPESFTVGENKLRGTDKFTPSRIAELAKLPPKEQQDRRREMITALRADPRWADERHPEHLQAVHEQGLLYDGLQMIDESINGGNE
jgi:hypothetical protein